MKECIQIEGTTLRVSSAKTMKSSKADYVKEKGDKSGGFGREHQVLEKASA